MMMAVAPAAWERYDRLTPAQLARVLLQMTHHANPKALRKHPRSTRSEPKKGYVPGALVRRHVATAHVLKDVPGGTALVLHMIVAWRIGRLRGLGRTCPDLDASLFFHADEIQGAYFLAK
jgi:hypothetical protein